MSVQAASAAPEAPRARGRISRWWRGQRPTLRVLLLILPGFAVLFALLATGQLWHLSSQTTGLLGPGSPRPQMDAPWRLWLLEGVAVALMVALGTLIAHRGMNPVRRRYSTPRLDVALLALAALALAFGPSLPDWLGAPGCGDGACAQPPVLRLFDPAQRQGTLLFSVPPQRPFGLLAQGTALPPLPSVAQWQGLLASGHGLILRRPFEQVLESHGWYPLTHRTSYIAMAGLLIGWAAIALGRRHSGLQGALALARIGPPLVLALAVLAASEAVQITLNGTQPIQAPLVDIDADPARTVLALEISARSLWDLQMMALTQAWRHAVSLVTIAWAMAFWVLVPPASVRHLRHEAEAAF